MGLETYHVFHFRQVRSQLAANIVLVGVATIMVVLRFIARRVRDNNVGFDDALAVGSLIFTYGMLSMQITYAKYGMGHHITEIPAENQIFVAKQLIAYQIVYYAAMATVKQSYLFFYLRIFPTQNFRRWVWVCMACVFGYWLGSMLQIFLICSPFEMNWNPAVSGGHCASYNIAFTTIGIFNMVTDILIMFLPIPFIRKLHMAIETKIALYVVFSIGIFVTAITIIRIRVLYVIDFNDLTYSMLDAAFWSVAEPAVAIINCCIPTLRPLLKSIFSSRWSSFKPSTNGNAYNHKNTTDQGSSKAFERMQEGEYPLTRLEDGVTDVTIMAGKSTPISNLETIADGDDDSLRQQHSGQIHQPRNHIEGINVRTEFAVSNHRRQSSMQFEL